MKTGKLTSNKAYLSGSCCPSCQQDIGFWAMVKSPLPNAIRCHHCQSKLKYSKDALLLTLLVPAIYLGLLAYLVLGPLSLYQSIVINIATALALWFPFELGLTWALRQHYKLEQKIEPNPKTPNNQ